MTKDMTVGRPFPLILNFAMPLLLGNLLQQAYSLIDAAIVGQTLGMNALAGVGSSVLFLILGFCNGVTGGFGIPIAQAFGAQDYIQVRRYVKVSYMWGAFFSFILAFACSLLCAHILRWMQTPEEIFEDAYIYLLITFITIPCNLVYNLLASIIRALGDSKTPFYFLLLAAVLNIVLDFLFILVFGMGVGGAALATAIAQLMSLLLCMVYMKRAFPILKKRCHGSMLGLCSAWVCRWACSSPSQPLAPSCCRVPTMRWARNVPLLSRLPCASRCSSSVPTRTWGWHLPPIADKTLGQRSMTASVQV